MDLGITHKWPVSGYVSRSRHPWTHVGRAQFYTEIKKRQEMNPKREGARFQEFQPLYPVHAQPALVYMHLDRLV